MVTTVRWAALAAALGVGGPAWAQHQYNPEQTFAFEDLSSGLSDEDHNDVVIRHAERCDLDRLTGLVAREEIRFAAVAAGASLTNTLVLDLPAPAAPGGVSLVRGSDPALPLIPDGTGRVELYADFVDAFMGAAPGFVNTTVGTPVPGVENVLEITFATPTSFGGRCPVPAFAIVNDSATVTTTSTLGANARPLAGNFEGVFQPPKERIPIWSAYQGFTAWADDLADNGQCDTQCASPSTMWYADPELPLVLIRPELPSEAPISTFPSCGDGAWNGDEDGQDCGGLVCACCEGSIELDGACDTCGGAAVTDLAPYLFWRLGETTGAVGDASGNGRTATWLGGTRGQVTPVWDGDAGARLIASTASGALSGSITDFAAEVTASLWLRTRAAEHRTLLSWASAAHDNDFLLIDAAALEVHAHNAVGSTGVALADGRWHHLAVSRASTGSVVVWLDGAVAWTGTVGSGPLEAAGRLVVGQDQDSVGGGFDAAQAWVGDLDEVAVFDHVLDASDVQRLYRGARCDEVCDGVDNDGDGLVDEGMLGEGSACAAPMCVDVRDDPGSSAGTATYWVDPGTGPVQVTCEMATAGGGWTVVPETTSFAYALYSEGDSTKPYVYSLPAATITAMKALSTEGRQDWACHTVGVAQCPGYSGCSTSTYQLNWIVWTDGSTSQFSQCQSPNNSSEVSSSGTSTNFAQLPAKEWHPEDCGDPGELCQHNVGDLWLR